MEQTEQERQAVEAKVAELRASRFKQMDLPAWRPVHSFMQTAAVFLTFGVVFGIVGLVLFAKSTQIAQTVYPYDQSCGPASPG